jgi:hypothetical protein
MDDADDDGDADADVDGLIRSVQGAQQGIRRIKAKGKWGQCLVPSWGCTWLASGDGKLSGRFGGAVWSQSGSRT